MMVQVRRRVLPIALMLAMALVVAGGTRVAAQDATPIAGGATAGIPNHIHAGTCDNLGDVVQPLASLQYVNTGGASGTPAAGLATPIAGLTTPVAGMMGGVAGVPVAVATTQASLSLSDILAAQHAINIHDPAAPEDPSRYLACGNISGTPDAQGNLFIGLQEDNNSGYSGVAWLLDNGSGSGTTVTIFLSNPNMTAGGALGTPMASPTS